MPSAADMEDGTATAFVLRLWVLMPTARQAPNCAKFAADAIGIQVLSPTEDSIDASMMLYMWCRPMTTVTG